jgi:hypothetical protein
MQIKIRWAAVAVLVMAVLGVVPAQEALAAETGYVCEYSDPVDGWGIHNGDEDSRRTNYISGYLEDTIRIWVDPEWPLDVAVGLFVCVDYVGGTDCRPLKVVDNKWEGGKEYLRYYVDPDDFSFTEILSGYWIIGVFAVDGCGYYKIEADAY